MNQNEHNFDDLKKLLKLKQHEMPPPGYFNHFSGQVVSRIRAGEAGKSQSFTERLQVEAPWAMSIFRIFETRPGLIGGFATSLCLLLVLAVVFAERSEHSSQNLLAISAEPAAASVENSVTAMTAPAPALVAGSDNSGIVASTNPVTSLQPTATLFGQAGGSTLFQPASFMATGH
ncbi:MAG TPA: hypothetical protein VIK62_06825 [Verrucomicrobiae bacterium]